MIFSLSENFPIFIIHRSNFQWRIHKSSLLPIKLHPYKHCFTYLAHSDYSHNHGTQHTIITVFASLPLSVILIDHQEVRRSPTSWFFRNVEPSESFFSFFFLFFIYSPLWRNISIYLKTLLLPVPLLLPEGSLS